MRFAYPLLALLPLASCGSAVADEGSCHAIEQRYLPEFEALAERGEALVDGMADPPTAQDQQAALQLRAELQEVHDRASADLAGCTGPKSDLKGLYGAL
ncbi:hypothetical protein [Sphingomicrobium arenosum]|uniref:hypothetical protein n=1 Tax=Sphingomicrobium arenosum TaxID=2233861 RepID=UPI0022410140|nr:hypothetical protein [Sphingomicrobium arenosum]